MCLIEIEIVVVLYVGLMGIVRTLIQKSNRDGSFSFHRDKPG